MSVPCLNYHKMIVYQLRAYIVKFVIWHHALNANTIKTNICRVLRVIRKIHLCIAAKWRTHFRYWQHKQISRIEIFHFCIFLAKNSFKSNRPYSNKKKRGKPVDKQILLSAYFLRLSEIWLTHLIKTRSHVSTVCRHSIASQKHVYSNNRIIKSDLNA